MGNPLTLIAPRSRAFLVEMFTDLRTDLESQMEEGGKGSPGSEEASCRLAMYEVLLMGLTENGDFPDDEAVRQYVAGLAKATDEANGYEQAALEHQAFAELTEALTR